MSKEMILYDIFKNTENFVISVDKAIRTLVNSYDISDEQNNYDLVQDVKEIEEARELHRREL